MSSFVTPARLRRPLLSVGDNDAFEVSQPGGTVAGQPGEVFCPGVVELEGVAFLVHHLGRVRHVPDLAFGVVVASVDTLAETVVEAAEVAATLAVHPAKIFEEIAVLYPVGIGEPE